MTGAALMLEPLILTVVIETAAALIMGIRKKKDLFLIFLANCITNPLLVMLSLLLMYNIGIGPGLFLTYLFLEPAVVYAEYRLFRKYLAARQDPFRLALVLNLFSVFGGVIWQKLF